MKIKELLHKLTLFTTIFCLTWCDLWASNLYKINADNKIVYPAAAELSFDMPDEARSRLITLLETYGLNDIKRKVEDKPTKSWGGLFDVSESDKRSYIQVLAEATNQLRAKAEADSTLLSGARDAEGSTFALTDTDLTGEKKLPGYCKNYPSLDVDESFYGSSSQDESLYAGYACDTQKFEVTVKDLVTHIKDIEDNTHKARVSKLDNLLLNQSMAALFKSINANESVYGSLKNKDGKTLEMLELKTCIESASKDNPELKKMYDEMLANSDSYNAKAEEEKKVEQSKFARTNMTKALLAKALFDRREEAGKKALQDYEAEKKAVSASLADEIEAFNREHDPALRRVIIEKEMEELNNECIAANTCDNEDVIAKYESLEREFDQARSTPITYSEETRNKIWEGPRKKEREGHAIAKARLDAKLSNLNAPLYGMVQKNPLLFKHSNTTDVGDWLTFNFRETELAPSSYMEKLIGGNSKLNSISEGIKNILNSNQDSAEANKKIGEYIEAHSNEIAQIADAKAFSEDFSALSKEQLNNQILDLKNSATSVCENRGDKSKLHHFPKMVDRAMAEAVGGLSPEAAKREMIQMQSAYCYKLRNSDINDGDAPALLKYAGLGAVVLGTALQFIPIAGNLAGTALIVAGTGTLVGTEVNDMNAANDRYQAAFAAHEGGWEDYQEVMKHGDDYWNHAISAGIDAALLPLDLAALRVAMKGRKATTAAAAAAAADSADEGVQAVAAAAGAVDEGADTAAKVADAPGVTPDDAVTGGPTEPITPRDADISTPAELADEAAASGNTLPTLTAAEKVEDLSLTGNQIDELYGAKDSGLSRDIYEGFRNSSKEAKDMIDQFSVNIHSKLSSAQKQQFKEALEAGHFSDPKKLEEFIKKVNAASCKN
jgi:hypothetical protein